MNSPLRSWPRSVEPRSRSSAIEIFDRPVRDAFADAQEAVIDWRPTDPFHVFAVEVVSAGYISFGVGARLLRWTPEGGFERLPHPED